MREHTHTSTHTYLFGNRGQNHVPKPFRDFPSSLFVAGSDRWVGRALEGHKHIHVEWLEVEDLGYRAEQTKR